MAKKTKKNASKNAGMKLNPVKFGLALGILTAACIFLTTLLGVAGYFPDYVALSAEWLGSIYGFLGYEVTFVGAIIGAVCGFIDCFILGWLFAALYNKLL